MCGIAGIAGHLGTHPSVSQMERMRDALAHRGPDGKAIEIHGANALVHARLAIIDLATGQQPLESRQGARLIGAGEIYNYVELWPHIHNHGPKTHSDFETALHLTTDFGMAAMERLRGMYVLAYCASDSRDVLLARDPFGIKQLYYKTVNDGIAFASEPRAFMAAGFADAVVDPEKRDELIDFHYTNGRDTIFKGIKRVLPGECLTIRDGTIAERSRKSAIPQRPLSVLNEDELLRQFDAVFQDSVDVHRRSDVPYGLFLSAGIDSSAILAVLARLLNEPVLCFTAGFDDPIVADESAAAARIARHFKAEHITVKYSIDDFWQSLPAVANALDDPTSDYAALPTFKLAAEARRHVKVVLTGEGGDELLAGYGRYRRALRPWWLGGRQPLRRSTIERLDLARGRVAWVQREREMRGAKAKAGTALQRAQAADIKSWLPNDILLKLDRCLMAHGLEGRTPFLDKEMANFAASLPDNMKIRNGMGKWLLRRWAEQYCPPADSEMPKKGFTVPVRHWISRRKSDLAELVSRQRGIAEAFRPEAVRAVFMASDERVPGTAAWSLLFYAVWHSVHICGANAQNDVFAVLTAGA